jgi:hypothetical protein
MANHIAAIHVLKSKLQLSDSDYRGLDHGPHAQGQQQRHDDIERQRVRDHMQGLAERMGVAKASHAPPCSRSFAASKEGRPARKERKVWALWNQLGRDGVVHNTSAPALNVWVERTVHVSALRFANSAQLDVLIEALKAWQQRGASDA